MSQSLVERITKQFGDRVLETSCFRGDDEVRVAVEDWAKVAVFLKDELGMDHFGDLTAVDHPERAPELPRFDVLLMMRSTGGAGRIRVRTRVTEGALVPSLCSVWAGANWAEREVWDMFGISFEGHPDMRRILMYEEFEGYPLRKDYPIERVQPLVPYRDVDTVHKLPPFGVEEGQPFGRIDWEQRLAGGGAQVSPSIALQTGERRTLSDSETAQEQHQEIRRAQSSAESDSSTGAPAGE